MCRVSLYACRPVQPLLGLTWADTCSTSGHHPTRGHERQRGEALLTLAAVMARHHGTRPHGGGLAGPFIGDNTTHLTVYYQAPFIGDRPVNPTSQLHQCVGFNRQVARHNAVEPKLHSSGNRSASIEVAVERKVMLDVDRPLHPAVIGVHLGSTSSVPLYHQQERPDMDATVRAARLLS